MDIVGLIKKKKNGDDLREEEIRHFTLGASEGKIHPVQIGAMLMAMTLKGLTNMETYYLTKTMIESGTKLKWIFPAGDKHSTGGVGDKVSIVLAPAVAAAGLRVPMVSGRSLDFTGGTLDKLESIPGFSVEMTVDDMDKALEKNGCFIRGTGSEFCPADKVLYSARDTTGTVNSNPLIIGSILSKKVAAGVNFFVLDLKVGKATFLNTEADARELATHLLELSKMFCLTTKVVLTRMDEPLGYHIGNSLEIEECLHIMKGGGPPDLKRLIKYFGSQLLCMSGIVTTLEEGEIRIENVLTNGEALKHFENMLISQKVDKDAAKTLCYGDPWEVMKRSNHCIPLLAEKTGWVMSIDALKIGEVVRGLGGGRRTPNQVIDHSVGVTLLKKKGSSINKGEVWLKLHHNTHLEECNLVELRSALSVSESPVQENDIIIDVISQW